MPKQKTHKGAAKRFKVTATGKIKHGSKGKGHILTCKAHSRKVDLRKGGYLESEQQTKTMRKLLNQ